MRHVVGMFETRAEAEQAIQRMKANGIATDSVSIAMRDTSGASDVVTVTDNEDMAGEGATAGVVSGAAVGTLVGLALVGSTFVLPGVGTFLVGGPLAAALTGAGVGAASGGILGALIGAGIPEHEATHFSAGMEAGHTLVSADVTDPQAQTVARIFDEEGSRRTHTA